MSTPAPTRAGSGGGTAAPDFVQRIKDDDRSDTEGSPRVVLQAYFGARGNAANVDEDFLLDETLLTAVGDDFYPGYGDRDGGVARRRPR